MNTKKEILNVFQIHTYITAADWDKKKQFVRRPADPVEGNTTYQK